MKEFSVITFLKKQYLYILLFIISSSFFIYQHFLYRSWEFIVYVLNAKYFLGEWAFFEAFRSPLISFILSIFSLFFSWSIAEYAYIILISFSFALSTYFLAKELNFKPVTFYIFSLSFFILLEGLFNGTELLTIALLEFTLIFILRKSPLAGLFIGLAALSKNAAFLFFSLLFFQFNLRNILYGFLLGFAILSSWLIYNKIMFGSYLYSIADQYAQNFLFGGYSDSSINPVHFLIIIGFLFPLFVVGLISIIKKVFSKLKGKGEFIEKVIDLRIEFLFLFLLILTTFIYLSAPLKLAKDLIYVTIPILYFAYLGFDKILSFIREDIRKYVSISILILLVIGNFGSFLVINYYYSVPEIPNSAIKTLENRDLSECLIYSNNWPYLNDKGYLSRPLPENTGHLEHLINNEKAVVLIFYQVSKPDYIFNKSYIRSLPIIEHHESQYTLITNTLNSCDVENEFVFSYLEVSKENIMFKDNIQINTNPCFVMFNGISLLERTCNFIDGKGFIVEENNTQT